jgi:hypothetical protein
LPAAARIEMIVKAAEEALRVKDLNTLELLRATASGVTERSIE